MKTHYFSTLIGIFICHLAYSQPQNQIENIIIVTTDGFRWQEVFKGMDASIAKNPKFNQDDSAGIFKKYWAETEQIRRTKLMPFLWNTIAAQGQIYGNRSLGCKVNVSNPYWFSYPGYSELFCGFVDTAINKNDYPANPNTNILEFINKLDGYKGKVAAYCAWDVFDRILNEKRSGFPVICGNDDCGGLEPDQDQRTINKLKKDTYNPFGEEAFDVFTHYAAMAELRLNKPKVLYISYGETDEWAHAGRYKDYLDAAHTVDNWLKDIWNFIQNSNIYKDKTLLIITVDHGRGLKDKWTSHNSKIAESDQIWFGIIGPQIPAKGEITTNIQLYQKQWTQTIADFLGLNFKCEHPVADGFYDVLRK